MARVGDRIFVGLTGGMAWGLVAAFALVVFILVQKAMPALTHFGPGFVTNDSWDVPNLNLGGLSYIWGTLASSLIALALAVPVAIGTAVALALLMPRRLAAVVSTVIELLAAVPSIVFGVWGLAVLVPFVAKVSGGRTSGPSLLSAGLVLAAMVLPIITAVSRDLIAAVSASQREAALALGATRWEVAWRVVLPNARAGLVAAILLGLGRAVGETMAVVMVIGNVAQIEGDIFQSAATLASVIANEFGDPSGPIHSASLVELGLVLLLLSLAMTFGARAITRRFRDGAA